MVDAPPYTIEFFEDENGSEPVLEWIRGLSPDKKRALGVALHEILAYEGNDVCGTEFGKALGQGLSEFRLRHDAEEILARRRKKFTQRIFGKRPKILLRVFFHAHGDKLILLVGGYDKGADPSAKRQQAEIELARKRLTHWRELEKRVH